VVLTVISILGIIGLATGDGVVAGAVGGALGALFGRPAWLSVFILLAVGLGASVSGFTNLRVLSPSSIVMATLFVSALSGFTHLTTGLGAEPSGPTGGGILGRAVGWNMVVALGHLGAYTILLVLLVVGLAFALLRPGPGLRYIATLGRIVIGSLRSLQRVAVPLIKRLNPSDLRKDDSAKDPAKTRPIKKPQAPQPEVDKTWQQAPLIKVKTAATTPSENPSAHPTASEDDGIGKRWKLPPFELLDEPDRKPRVTNNEITERASLIESTLASYNISAK